MQEGINYFPGRNTRKGKPKSGHTNILPVSGGMYIVRLGGIDFPRRYTKDEIPEAVQFRDQWREKNGYPKADY